MELLSQKTESWNESRDCCSWDGVTCDLLNGHVIGLDLSCSLLFGTFHPNSSLFQLHHLQTLNLANNYFDSSSSIPHNIGRLTNLRHLNLSHSSFGGKIPTEISYLSNLVSLDLSGYGLQLDERTFEAMFQNLTNLEVLSLSEVNIKSPIPVSIHPNSSLFQLHHLHTLNLDSNYFNPSSIPNGIGRLRNLRHLKLSGFDGKIPTEISYLSNLVSLHLSFWNGLQLDERTFEAMFQNFTNLEILSLFEVNISSAIPVNISSSSLRYLDLGYTNLRGVLTESFLLPSNRLETLKLSDNDLLKGVFPKFHRSNTLLMELDISFTGISGELPHLIGTFSSLNILNLGGCQFSGSIPDSIGNLTQIRELDLSNNHFTGHIPSTISKLKHLTRLYLSHNSFSGEIPDVFSNLQELRTLHLSYNSFIGSFPASILSLTNLQYLDMSSNSLSGPLPSNQSMLQKLTSVDLSYNSLNGHIPMELGQLNTLEALDLSWNRLTGKIPQELTRMNFLAVLNLSQNHLVGPIPHVLQFNTFENDSYGGNLDLCGLPLTKKCGTSDSSHVPQQLESEEEGESYFFSGFTWESVVIGYSFGLVVGTVMWSLMFKYRKPKCCVQNFLPLAFFSSSLPLLVSDSHHSASDFAMECKGSSIPPSPG
ncbi:leucine-rich repeat receptor-like serine/threonine-protein kinase At1g17230 [Solanum tuberosum]|uniref:leucine-rich repeat receptor-like serine/threonine-protein kinase At1g17230 n=1 Tax=Solanum tuberosum TaxID=4113 RepID=UPI00073A0BF0|nr:PREDICTED: leucine-rich repeat receptor-like serine/threonine-protein kinase At1g17230 [Solanum tuberosum]